MPESIPRELWYVYGIVMPELSRAKPPAGVDDARVHVEEEHGLGALVSVLDGTEYEPATLEARSGSVEWLSPRAIAHDRVLTWASDHGPVIPLPMFSMFSGSSAVHGMLRDRASQLAATLAHISAAAAHPPAKTE